MPKINEIRELIRSHITPYIRIYDSQDNRICTIETGDVESAISQLDQMLPYFSTYGRLKVEAANQSIKNRKYQDAFWWNLDQDRPAAAQDTGNAIGKIPAGYVHEGTLAKEIAILNLKFEHERELRKLQDEAREKEKSDPVKMIKDNAPMLLYALGKPLEEIAKVTAFLNTPQGQMPQAIAGPPAQPGSHTLVFKDVSSLSTDEKHAKLQGGMDQLAGNCSLEHMIMLVDGLNKKLDPKQGGNPEFIATILSFL